MKNRYIIELEKREITNWDVICIKPFSDKKDYVNWIKENDIATLILDERLNEKDIGVNYKGSQIISYLRENFKELPIYSFSAFADEDKDIITNATLFESVVDKDNFVENYFERSLRAAQRYWNTYQKELNSISNISKKLALGNASEKEVAELKSLQTKLMIPGITEQIINKTEWLEKFEENINKFEDVTKKLNRLLDKRKEQ
ncbi:MAG: hypothetical protein SFU98_20460 [Leptospiraceae bacterium]|nr:hypothetical protein [Leptospiraceae bacterium]